MPTPLTPLIVIFLTASIFGCQSKDSPDPSASKPLARFAESHSTLTTSVRPEPSTTAVTVRAEAHASVTPSIVEDDAHTPLVERSLQQEPDLREVDGVAVQRLVTANDVGGREPVETSTTFAALQRIYAFVEVRSDSADATTFTVNFIGPSGQVRGGTVLAVPAGSPRWRTWAYTERAEEHGPWRVEVRSEDGALVGSLPFEVGPGC